MLWLDFEGTLDLVSPETYSGQGRQKITKKAENNINSDAMRLGRGRNTGYGNDLRVREVLLSVWAFRGSLYQEVTF